MKRGMRKKRNYGPCSRSRLLVDATLLLAPKWVFQEKRFEYLMNKSMTIEKHGDEYYTVKNARDITENSHLEHW